jgi:hypothetical protein
MMHFRDEWNCTENKRTWDPLRQVAKYVFGGVAFYSFESLSRQEKLLLSSRAIEAALWR